MENTNTEIQPSIAQRNDENILEKHDTYERQASNMDTKLEVQDFNMQKLNINMSVSETKRAIQSHKIVVQKGDGPISRPHSETNSPDIESNRVIPQFTKSMRKGEGATQKIEQPKNSLITEEADLRGKVEESPSSKANLRLQTGNNLFTEDDQLVNEEIHQYRGDLETIIELRDVVSQTDRGLVHDEDNQKVRDEQTSQPKFNSDGRHSATLAKSESLTVKKTNSIPAGLNVLTLLKRASSPTKIKIQSPGNSRQTSKHEEKYHALEQQTVGLSSYKQSFDMWLRSEVPDFITCQHVWWILHSCVTAVLLWLYFTNKIGNYAGIIAVAELLVGVGVRNEPLLILLHILVAYVPIGKYFFNRMLHCIGGVHYSAAINAMLWLLISMIREPHNTAVYITGYSIFAMVIVLILTALPPVRRRQHNTFEYFHRYLGWTALGVLVAHVILVQLDVDIDMRPTIRAAFGSGPTLMVIFIVFVIILPWLLVRKVDVSWSQPSKLLTIATFKGTYNPYGTRASISFDAKEWHSFAIALCNPDKNNHQLVIAKAGDWTTMIAEGCAKGTLPNKMYFRKLCGTGFMYSVCAYERVLIVCTGSGIAPALPYIKNPIPTTHTHILWVASKHRETFGDYIMDILEKTAPNYTIYDTKVHGRPKPELAKEWYFKTQAQAVFIVSNESYTDAVVNYLWKQGIPAFGALFDS